MARDLVSPLRRLGSAGPSTLVATLVDLGDRGLAGQFPQVNGLSGPVVSARIQHARFETNGGFRDQRLGR